MTAAYPPSLVACLGDSITQGQVSANYVRRLADRWRPSGVEVLNAGVNGDLAYNIAARLDPVIQRSPDVVTLLVGTNDVNAQFDDLWLARYRKDQRLPVRPTLQWYAEQVDLILSRLAAQTSARVAVLEIPPLGEDLASRMNALVNDYNARLHEVAAGHGVPVLPLHDRLVAMLPTGRSAPTYEGRMRPVMTAGVRHVVLRQSWDSISRSRGLTLLTDHIHLNDRAAAVVSSLIDDFVAQSLGGPGA
mgnify:CR=1 FL=1